MLQLTHREEKQNDIAFVDKREKRYRQNKTTIQIYFFFFLLKKHLFLSQEKN